MNIIKIVKNRAILEVKTLFNRSIFASVLAFTCLLGVISPQVTNADFFIPCVGDSNNKVVKTIKVVITAYSSTPDQTDDTPFVTASNKQVADGIVANNMLPFGTKIKIPKLYGDKIFVVEDRMHKRMGNYRLDIWMPERQLALNFGVKTANIEILED